MCCGSVAHGAGRAGVGEEDAEAVGVAVAEAEGGHGEGAAEGGGEGARGVVRAAAARDEDRGDAGGQPRGDEAREDSVLLDHEDAARPHPKRGAPDGNAAATAVAATSRPSRCSGGDSLWRDVCRARGHAVPGPPAPNRKAEQPSHKAPRVGKHPEVAVLFSLLLLLCNEKCELQSVRCVMCCNVVVSCGGEVWVILYHFHFFFTGEGSSVLL